MGVCLAISFTLSKFWYKKSFLFDSFVLRILLNYFFSSLFFLIFVVLEFLLKVNLQRNQVNEDQIPRD